MPSRMRFVLLFLAVLTALLGFATAAAYTSPFQNIYCATPQSGNSGYQTVSTLGQCISGAIVYVIIALLLSFTIVALAYLFGEVLNIQSFKGWYRSELWEAIKSLIIVGAVFSAILIFGEFAALLPGAPTPIPLGGISGFDYLYQTGFFYLAGSPTAPGAIDLVNESYNNLLGISVGSELLKNFKVQSYFTIPFPPVPWPGAVVFGSLNLGADFNPYVSSVLNTGPTASANLELLSLQYLLLPMLVVIGAQTYLFIILIQIGLGVLLPLGLILRAIPFLRGIGGTLIALAIATVIIYPALLAFFNAPITFFFSPLYPTQATVTPSPCEEFIECALIGGYNLYPELTFANLPSTTVENDEGAFLNGFFAGQNAFFGDPTTSYAASLSPVLSTLFNYLVPVVVQFILLVLDLIIGYTVTQNVAKVLGGNIRLGIGNLKLA